MPRHLLLKRCENITTEPAAAEPATETTPATALLWPRRSSEIEKLSRRGSDDPDQQRDRDREHDQRAAVDKYPRTGLRISHARNLIILNRI
jgi:hypothetical protein